MSYPDLNKLNTLLLNRVDDLLKELRVDVITGRHYYQGRCPLHAGADNPVAFAVNLDKGQWRCYTKSCNDTFKSTLIGLIRGKLSRDNYGWGAEGDSIVSFSDTLRWTKHFLNIENYNNLDLIIKSAPKVEIAANRFNPLLGYPRDKVRARLKLPCQYFVKRGFDPRILDMYDVGTCLDPMQLFYCRTCLPCYDESNERLVGITGRSIFTKCIKCNYYHNTINSCPSTPKEFSRAQRWKHSVGFDRANYLYNLWKEFDYIQERRRVIMVESPGNCLKLISAGVRNVVGIFGTTLTNSQAGLLHRGRVKSIILALDNDAAGNAAMIKIKNQYSNDFNIKVVTLTPPNKDVADFDDKSVRDRIIPILRGIKF